MKVIVYTMDGCPHCEKIKEELKSVPESKKFIMTEKKHISAQHKKKYGITKYPTIVYLTDDNRMIHKTEGFQTADDIKLDYSGSQRLDKLFKRTGKLY